MQQTRVLFTHFIILFLATFPINSNDQISDLDFSLIKDMFHKKEQPAPTPPKELVILKMIGC